MMDPTSWTLSFLIPNASNARHFMTSGPILTSRLIARSFILMIARAAKASIHLIHQEVLKSAYTTKTFVHLLQTLLLALGV